MSADSWPSSTSVLECKRKECKRREKNLQALNVERETPKRKRETKQGARREKVYSSFVVYVHLDLLNSFFCYTRTWKGRNGEKNHSDADQI